MTSNPNSDPKTRKGAIRWLVRETVSNLFLIAILFGIVGRWDWWAGWALSRIYIFWSVAVGVMVLPVNPQMLAERARPHPGTKKWDKIMYVRHPGYLGTILMHLGTPFLLGSLWAFLPAVLVILVFVVRTALEDKTLQEELPGYLEYTQSVRYRLLPGVW
jgi:protein-S-isoprenylcysteine O-methyltransferase Ste14